MYNDNSIEKEYSFKKWCLENWMYDVQVIIAIIIITITEETLKCAPRLTENTSFPNAICKTIKFLEKNRGENPCNLGFGDEFSDNNINSRVHDISNS